MMTVVLAQMASRWGQTVTLLMLSVAVTVAAVGVHLFAVAIDRTSAANVVASAESAELVVSLPPLTTVATDDGGGTPTPVPAELSAVTAARDGLAGLDPVTTVQIQVRLQAKDDSAAQIHRLLARDGFCRHVTFLEGRCPVGSREAAVPMGLAGESGISAGDEVVLTPEIPTSFGGWVPDGPPATITVVGLFEPADPADPYWAAQFPLGLQSFEPAIITNRTTLQTLPHTRSTFYLDAVVPAHVLIPERIPELRRNLDAAAERLADDGFALGLTTRLPRLMDRIERQGDEARALLPIAAAPLMVLGWFVIYLAVGHGVSGRRREAGVVALRGPRWATRAAAQVAESLLPLLAGVPAGLLVAHLLVGLVPGLGGVGPVAIDTDQLLAAGIAAAGIIGAALVAMWHQLAVPIGQLLREVGPRGSGTAVAAAEVLTVALGAVIAIDSWRSDGDLSGLMIAAPVMVMLAVAVLATRVVGPLIDFAGRRSLRRGRLGAAMAALHLARRPGSARVLVVVALVLGTFGFAAVSTNIAAQGRAAEAQRQLGADRVLEIQAVNRGELLQVVRDADPGGRYAMAAVSVRRASDQSPVIAVDSTRLHNVALWSDRYGETEPAQVEELLRPPASEPMMVTDGELAAELSLADYSTDGTLTLSLLLAPPAGDGVSVTFDSVTNDQLIYRAQVDGCADSCRLAGLTVTKTDPTDTILEGLAVHSLRQAGQDVIPPDRLTDAESWRIPEQTNALQEHLRVAPQGDALMLSPSRRQPIDGYQALAVDVPYPLPVVSAGGPVGELLTSIDSELIQVVSQAQLSSLPGIGGSGVLMDLEYTERLTAEPGAAWSPQVWLTEDAPGEIVDQLRDQGLVIIGDHTVGELQASLNGSGAATVLRVYGVAASVAVLMGLGAFALVVAVDRGTWSRGLKALCDQGVAARTTTAAALWSYGGVVVAGALAGLLAGGVAWLAAGERLPLGVDKSLLTDWPQWAPVLTLWTSAVAVMLGAAIGGAIAVQVAVAGHSSRTGGRVNT